MAGYVRHNVEQLLRESPAAILGDLQSAYASDGFVAQYTKQTLAWAQIVPILQNCLAKLVERRPESADWTVILEYPLYRLRRRIDLVILAGSVVIVVETKVGAEQFSSTDRRQVEEYALDLSDFHAGSRNRRILPVLWSTEVSSERPDHHYPPIVPRSAVVGEVIEIGAEGLLGFLTTLDVRAPGTSLVGEEWDAAAYLPVPNVIEAATLIFAEHGVRSIANSDADNLREAAARLIELIEQARSTQSRYLLVLTGVPGSGKTLAGLHVVHETSVRVTANSGDAIYLSGNVPLVVVLREALSRDVERRAQRTDKKTTVDQVRRDVRARIQHLNDFLRASLTGPNPGPPHEHIVVFDEAQRAWDEKQGQEKFDRKASESSLILEIMSRHSDWCVCVCLVGGGQEINSGEQGVRGWGDALRIMPEAQRAEWSVYAPPDVLSGGASAGTFTIGELVDAKVHEEKGLQLRVPQRSYRSPDLSRWVDHVLAGDASSARALTQELKEYPITLTRSLETGKSWLKERGRGERRYGLVASSGARRLRADGLGVTLHASGGDEIAYWYLNEHGDIRSSYALEVPANEYTCQGLELDFSGVCWGGDMLWDPARFKWKYSRLSGTKWQKVSVEARVRYLINSYRVLLTRAREGVVLWIPVGEYSDSTRSPEQLADTAAFLLHCGASSLDE